MAYVVGTDQDRAEGAVEAAREILAETAQGQEYGPCANDGCMGTSRLFDGQLGFCRRCRARHQMGRARKAIGTCWLAGYDQREVEELFSELEVLLLTPQPDYQLVITQAKAIVRDVAARCERVKVEDELASFNEAEALRQQLGKVYSGEAPPIEAIMRDPQRFQDMIEDLQALRGDNTSPKLTNRDTRWKSRKMVTSQAGPKGRK